MTIDEAMHRVVRGHWLVILLCVLLPVGLSVYVFASRPPLYAAVSRLQIGTAPASSNVQADAESDRVTGIATSPGVVEHALATAGLHDMDPVKFAQHHVSIERVGVSPIVSVVVTDPRPSRAATIATSITNDVLDFANAGDRKPETDRLEELDKTIVSLGKSRDSLIAKLAKADRGEQLRLTAQINAVQTTLADDLRQRSDLIVAASGRSTAVLLDPVREPTVPLPKDIPQKAVLAGLLGLLAGIALAALWESVRPTMQDRKAISLALGVPVIGHVDRRELNARGPAVLAPVASRMSLLAHRFNSSRAVLLPVRATDESWAERVAHELCAASGIVHSHTLECVALDGQWRQELEGRPAAVLFSPVSIRARELEPTKELLSSVQWPLVGIVTYDTSTRGGWLPWRRGPGHRAHGPVAPPTADQREERAPAAPGSLS